MATKIDYTKVDFVQIQNDLINFIKSSSTFADVNREGANFQLLIKLLSYITEILSFNTNQVANEMNLATVELRKNVLRLIKTLNYFPTPTNSSEITVDLDISDTSVDFTSKFLLKYDKIAGGGYDFYYLGNDIELLNPDIDGHYHLSAVTFKEGKLIELPNAYTGDGTDFQIIDILDPSIGPDFLMFTYDTINDIRTYWNRYEYGKFYSDPETEYIYFIEEIEGGYRIKTGNDHFGRKPIVGERIDFEYIRPTGSLANGTNAFLWQGKATNTILQQNNLVDVIKAATIVTTSGYSTVSINGNEKESVEEIKFNAPRFNRSQGRAVTEDDYLALIITKPEIDKATVLGGDKFFPVRLGKVYITVKPKLDIHPNENFTTAELATYKTYLDGFSVVTIEPIVQNAFYVYLKTTSKLRYSSNVFRPNVDTIKNSIYNFVNVMNSNFGEYLEDSKLVATIDGSDKYITSSLTTVEKFVLIAEDSFTPGNENGTYALNCSKNITTSGLEKIEKYDFVNKTVTQTWTLAAGDFTYTILDPVTGSVSIDMQQTGGVLGLSETGVLAQYEFRFFFETQDSDIFLNKFQLFNISLDDINLSLEKI